MEKIPRPPYSSWLDEVPVMSDKNRSDMQQKKTQVHSEKF